MRKIIAFRKLQLIQQRVLRPPCMERTRPIFLGTFTTGEQHRQNITPLEQCFIARLIWRLIRFCMRNCSCVLAFFMTQAFFFSTSHFVQRLNFKNRIKTKSICVKQGNAIIHNYALEQFGNKDLTLLGACFKRYPFLWWIHVCCDVRASSFVWPTTRRWGKIELPCFLMAASRYPSPNGLTIRKQGCQEVIIAPTAIFDFCRMHRTT